MVVLFQLAENKPLKVLQWISYLIPHFLIDVITIFHAGNTNDWIDEMKIFDQNIAIQFLNEIVFCGLIYKYRIFLQLMYGQSNLAFPAVIHIFCDINSFWHRCLLCLSFPEAAIVSWNTGLITHVSSVSKSKASFIILNHMTTLHCLCPKLQMRSLVTL